jgi:hypothetical protein
LRSSSRAAFAGTAVAVLIKPQKAERADFRLPPADDEG